MFIYQILHFLCTLSFSCISSKSTINTKQFKSSVEVCPVEVCPVEVGSIEVDPIDVNPINVNPIEVYTIEAYTKVSNKYPAVIENNT